MKFNGVPSCRSLAPRGVLVRPARGWRWLGWPWAGAAGAQHICLTSALCVIWGFPALHLSGCTMGTVLTPREVEWLPIDFISFGFVENLFHFVFIVAR